MKTTNKTTVMKDRKAMLSLLWIFVMFNFTRVFSARNVMTLRWDSAWLRP
jgi:hypothetical protein